MKEQTKTVLKVAVATVAWCAVHSLFASRKVKQTVKEAAGEDFYRRFYRPFYNLQSVGTLLLLGSYTRKLPDTSLFKTEGKTADLIRIGQGISIAYFAWGVYHVKQSRLSGIQDMIAKKPQEQEGQGPTLTPDGTLDISGAYRHSRHALNFAAIPPIWLFPRMGSKHATFNVIATIYFWLGSLHEEKRQREAYGEQYERYRKSGVPFFFPRRR